MSDDQTDFEDFSGNSEKLRGLFTLAAVLAAGVAAALLVKPLIGALLVLIAAPAMRLRARSRLAKTIAPGPSSQQCENCGALQTEIRVVEGTTQVEFVCNSCAHTWNRRRTSIATLL